MIDALIVLLVFAVAIQILAYRNRRREKKLKSPYRIKIADIVDHFVDANDMVTPSRRAPK